MIDRLDIEVCNDADEVRRLVDAGWCPIECAFGTESIVDALRMDHHGSMSHEESVAIRACRDHYGVRAGDPRFMLAGIADADATFAIAALAGLVPAPHDPGTLYALDAMTTTRSADRGTDAEVFDSLRLAHTIAVMDTDPIGRDLAAMPFGDILQCWNALFGGGRDRLAAFAGVYGWRLLTTAPHSRLAPFLSAATDADARRRAQGRADLDARGRYLGRVLLVSGAEAPAFDIWYGRRPEAGPPDDPAGWNAPVVVALSPQGTVTIGCPNGAVAAALFGPGGLANVYPRLSPPGWGGRDAIGGSPRGMTLDEEAVMAAVEQVNASIRAVGAAPAASHHVE